MIYTSFGPRDFRRQTLQVDPRGLLVGGSEQRSRRCRRRCRLAVAPADKRINYASSSCDSLMQSQFCVRIVVCGNVATDNPQWYVLTPAEVASFAQPSRE